MSELSQTEKSGWATGKSALPSRTDIIRPARLVRFVPISEVNVIRSPCLRAPRREFNASGLCSPQIAPRAG
jgi:hypothetical protein